MSIVKKYFGNLQDGSQVDLFTLTNPNNMKVGIINYGGTVVSIEVPDKNGKFDDVALGYDTIEKYCKNTYYFGALIGRHGNRIEDSEFELNGKVYHLAVNDGKNHLHGGIKGFDKVIWKAEPSADGKSLKLSYSSADGEENYPGNLDVTVTYTLTDENELILDYFAVSDKDTVVNLTNHAYFNLAGHASGDVLKHQMMINADKFTVINNEGIPTGEIRDVKGTPMDFTELTEIGKGINSTDEQIVCGKGYDHNWVLNVSGKKPEKAAEVYCSETGRLMEVFTTKPGVQFYSGNFIQKHEGKNEAIYDRRGGLCLETQFFPNAMKHKHFPSPILKAGEEYRYTTIYKFSTVK
jgi:aldose 1-epimerase